MTRPFLWRVGGAIACGAYATWALFAVAEARVWPDSWAGRAVLASMALIVIGGLTHIGYVWARTAGDVFKAYRDQSYARPVRVRLRGWLLAFAFVAWPLTPTYYGTMGELENPEVGSHLDFLLGAGILVGVWIFITATRRPDQPGPVARFFRRRWAMRIAIPGAVLISIFAGYVIAASPTVAAEGTVIRVVDGDTVDVRVWGKEVRVRLLNIDTPETVDPQRPKECLGAESTRFTKSMLPPGEVVQLEFDNERGPLRTHPRAPSAPRRSLCL